jgi:hypothetical protein
VSANPSPNRTRRPYARHRPEDAALYAIVRDHLEAFLDEAREKHGRDLPRYVVQELRAHLKCGIPAHGFLHARCRSCGHEMIVAFSCKRRAVRPSCNARRMCNTAAHLVDRVFPEVPVRQWVLSVPFELRLALARSASAFGALLRIFASEVQRLQGRRAARAGIARGHFGGVSFPQRFGGSLNLNTHVHAVFVDGVFTFHGDRAEFHRLSPPDPIALASVCERTATRLARYLKRRGLVAEEPDWSSNESPAFTALDACALGALGVGKLVGIDERGRVEEGARDDPLAPFRRKGSRHAAEALGFHLHTGVAVPAENRFGREILLRYCARPPLSLERLSILPDGRIAYRIKKPWRKDQTHRVMTPLEFMARLVALIPPPRTPLVHFHGVFAPRFRDRRRVIPPTSVDGAKACGSEGTLDEQAKRSAKSRKTVPRERPTGPCGANTAAVGPAPPTSRNAPERAPTSRRDRIPRTQPDGRAFRSAPYRMDWATLLFRVYDVDALACPCGGRLRFLELVTERPAVCEILTRLGLPTDAPMPLPASASRALDELPPPDWCR